MHAGKTRLPFLGDGLERPHRTLGGLKPSKVGSLQPNPVFCSRPKVNVASCASSVLLNTSVHRRGERNARQKVICVFHAKFTFPRQKSRLNLTRIFAPLPLQRPQKQKMSKTNCDRHRSVPALPSFLFLVCGNDFTRPTGDINVNWGPTGEAI
jgi:hypothetical protein